MGIRQLSVFLANKKGSLHEISDIIARAGLCTPAFAYRAIHCPSSFEDTEKARRFFVFEELYSEVACGNEAQRSIDTNSQPDYRQKLEEELKEMRETEMWQAGAVVRKLRPENN